MGNLVSVNQYSIFISLLSTFQESKFIILKIANKFNYFHFLHKNCRMNKEISIVSSNNSVLFDEHHSITEKKEPRWRGGDKYDKPSILCHEWIQVVFLVHWIGAHEWLSTINYLFFFLRLKMGKGVLRRKWIPKMW